MNKTKQNLVVLSGAGISAESGLQTFRDADGLWEGHDIMEVASPQGFSKNPELVFDFYNQRRKQLSKVEPNAAHLKLALLEKDFKVQIITQNVDDLHERAGSTDIIHLHGELLKARSVADENEIYPWDKDLNIGDFNENSIQLRPHIVWFGEDVPLLEKAIEIVSKADFIIIVGTSMQVYPAANLINYAPLNCQVYFIDPAPKIQEQQFNNLKIIAEPATIGVSIVANLLTDKAT